jgi:hypothetical protein
MLKERVLLNVFNLFFKYIVYDSIQILSLYLQNYFRVNEITVVPIPHIRDGLL